MDKSKNKKKEKSGPQKQQVSRDVADSVLATTSPTIVTSLPTTSGKLTEAHDLLKQDYTKLKEECAKLKMDNEAISRDNKAKSIDIEQLTMDRQLLESLHAATRKDIGDTPIREIYDKILLQREEMIQIATLIKKQAPVMKTVKEAISKGNCPRCAVRRSLDNSSLLATPDVDERNLSTAIQCEEDLSSTRDDATSSLDDSQRRKKIMLLNDGQTLPMTASGSIQPTDFELATGGGASVRGRTDERFGDAASASHPALVYQSDGGRRNFDWNNDETPTPSTDFAFRVDSVPSTSGAAGLRPPRVNLHVCPMCARFESYSMEELTQHVNSHFPDEDMPD